MIRLVPFRVASSLMVTFACNVEGGRGQEGPPRQERVAPQVPDADADEEPFANPWIDASKVAGGAPLVERLNDDQGMRYVIGAGEFADADGTAQRLPSVLTMQAGIPFEGEGIDPEAAELPDATTPSKVGLELAAAVASAEDADDMLAVTVVVRTDETGVQAALERAMAMGTVHTRLDYEQEHDILVEERQERILSATSPVREEIEDAGGIVLWHGENTAVIAAELPADAVDALAARADVRLIDVGDKHGSLLAPSDGLVHQHGAQIRQFIQNGWTGEGGAGVLNDMVIAIVEMNDDGMGNKRSFHTSHDGWLEAMPPSDLRYELSPGSTGRWDCTNTILGCQSTAVFAEQPGNHATNIAGIIFGDVTQGQMVVPAADHERLSGFAREARAHFYLTTTAATTTEMALNHIMGLPASIAPHVVNNSYKHPWAPYCEGSSSTSVVANDVYLAGIAMFAGASNEHGSATDCQTVSPADAIGVFTVGAHMTTYGNELNYRNDGIFDPTGNEGSAWGGNATQGDNRSIVDLTAGAPRNGLFKPDGTYTLATGSIGRTSYATAIVSATAIDIMDHRFAAGDTWIDTPGFLYAMMLVMGDRQGVNGKANHTPDHQWGVGRLRARLLGSGLDAPYYWYAGVTCIGEAETWDFNPFGTAMPTTVDAVKVAAYWYDHRHESNAGTQVANVNLALRTSSAGGLAGQVEADWDSFDNKAWAFAADWPQAPVILRLIGTNGVTGHNDPICGTNQVRVYFAIFAEDSLRDSPTYDPLTGQGIYPEHL